MNEVLGVTIIQFIVVAAVLTWLLFKPEKNRKG